MVENQNTLELLQGVACQITGQYVEVHIQKPDEGTKAVSYANDNGSFSIDIRPDMAYKLDDYLDAFLHECGHIRLHSDWMKSGLMPDFNPEDARKVGVKTLMEHEAKKMGGLWKKHGWWNADNYDQLFHNNKITQDMQRQLCAILAIPDEVQADYDRKVKSIFRYEPEGIGL